jgi:hypothetical protein
MRKNILLALALCALWAPVRGQEKQAAPATEAAREAAPHPSDEQQREFMEAAGRVQEARKDAELAQARAQALVFRLMATLKLSPDEWRAVVTKEGLLAFERIPPASSDRPPEK